MLSVFDENLNAGILPRNWSEKLHWNDVLVLSDLFATLTTELSALDRISALEVKLEKIDTLISYVQSLKLEINSLKKPDYPYIRAAFRNRTDSTASDRNSKKRKTEGNENLFADKEFQDRKPNIFKTGTNINHQTTVRAI